MQDTWAIPKNNAVAQRNPTNTRLSVMSKPMRLLTWPSVLNCTVWPDDLMTLWPYDLMTYIMMTNEPIIACLSNLSSMTTCCTDIMVTLVCHVMVNIQPKRYIEHWIWDQRFGVQFPASAICRSVRHFCIAHCLCHPRWKWVWFCHGFMGCLWTVFHHLVHLHCCVQVMVCLM